MSPPSTSKPAATPPEIDLEMVMDPAEAAKRRLLAQKVSEIRAMKPMDAVRALKALKAEFGHHPLLVFSRSPIVPECVIESRQLVLAGTFPYVAKMQDRIVALIEQDGFRPGFAHGKKGVGVSTGDQLPDEDLPPQPEIGGATL